MTTVKPLPKDSQHPLFNVYSGMYYTDESNPLIYPTAHAAAKAACECALERIGELAAKALNSIPGMPKYVASAQAKQTAYVTIEDMLAPYRIGELEQR